MNNMDEMKTLTPEELEKVEGGASDYSQTCGMQIQTNCIFCTKNKPGQVVYDGGVRDCIGCSLSFEPFGSIDNFLIINNQRIPVPPQ